ncbi:lipoprotein-releasing ABC transporter permease subunit LolE [Thorsellia anophelis]|uniref:Lipoprotein-releasing system permease protein n=1 Tax=Thorsellia anophelis DSM 18579 TaxID=1123402 RepID=A0A1I0BM87_9GAMM|nr:lipoprotein-releasing ABC transporter permease subunit LolE [Thorsellia anophelis]SET08066.1 lipoprotein-releasing system permease protein [Thorsellia anophelis DSM 18579]
MFALPLTLKTALRFSRGKKRGGMVSLISLFSTLGISLGVAVLIVGLSAMNGFERELVNRVLGVVPHGEIIPEQPMQIETNLLVNRIEASDGVVAAAPYVSMTGLVENGIHLQTIQIKGIDTDLESKISALPKFISDNAWNSLQPDKNQIILGAGAARSIGAKVGQSVTIIIPNSSADLKLQQPKRIRLQIIGLIELGGLIDHSLGLIPLEDAQSYLGKGQEITGVGLKLSDPFQARTQVKKAAENTRLSLHYNSWINQYGFMYNDIQMIRGIMYLAMVLVMAVACFNIVSTLVVAVKEKSTDIAILRTLGAKNRFILSIFIWYGLISGFIGTFIGALIGIAAALYLTNVINALEAMLGVEFLSADIYFVDFLPSELHLLDVFLVFTTSIVLSLVASLYPANRAIKLEPAKILSGQ